MITASDKIETSAKLLADDEDWLTFVESEVCKDSSSVDSLAHVLFRIKNALSEGPGGVKAASDALLDGIKVTYLYTDAHKAALELYLIYLTGHLKPQDEPVELLRSAIERGKAEIKRASVITRKTKRRPSDRKKRKSKGQ